MNSPKQYARFNRVLNINDKKVEFQYPVAQFLNWNGIVIVRVEPDVGQIFNKNIYVVSQSGNIIWQVEESPHGEITRTPIQSDFF